MTYLRRHSSIIRLEHVSAGYDFDVNSGKVVAIHLEKHTDIVTLFRQLFVLIPVLDNYKHHRIGEDEAEKLLRYGDGGSNRIRNELLSQGVTSDTKAL